MKYELIIFDCDGTLVDSESISIKVIKQMFDDLGIHMTYEEVKDEFIGTRMQKIIEFVEKNSAVQIDFDFQFEYRQRTNLLFEEELICFDGVMELLEKINIPMCIASNGPRVKMDTTLSVTGLDKYFTPKNIFSAYDFNKWKPDPQIFYEILKQYNISKNKALVIDDTISGVMGAINAGVDVFAFCPGKVDPNIIEKNVPVYKDMFSIEKQIFAT